MPSRTEADLLAGIVAHPEEMDRWLVLADWLEDQGDPRAELARLRHRLHTEPDHPEADARRARQLALLDAGLAPVVPTWTNPLGMPFALVLPGTFRMGSPETEADRYDGEVPHPVTLTAPFYLGVYPVTVGEFAAFVAATGYQTEAETDGGAWGYAEDWCKKDAALSWRTPGFEQTDRHPVVCVTWNDAQALTAWLNQVEEGGDLVYALPTEAQWEYACRAGSATAYWWGDDPTRLGDYAWFADNSGEATHPVETKKPNPWGLYHLHGLVSEWCNDVWDDYPFTAVTDPQGAPDGSDRLNRGGDWIESAQYCRAASRRGSDPRDRYDCLGLRLARVPVR